MEITEQGVMLVVWAVSFCWIVIATVKAQPFGPGFVFHDMDLFYGVLLGIFFAPAVACAVGIPWLCLKLIFGIA